MRPCRARRQGGVHGDVDYQHGDGAGVARGEKGTWRSIAASWRGSSTRDVKDRFVGCVAYLLLYMFVTVQLRRRAGLCSMDHGGLVL